MSDSQPSQPSVNPLENTEAFHIDSDDGVRSAGSRIQASSIVSSLPR